MSKLKYIIDNETIIELFGLQNFTTKESAILELVKNAYDAGSPSLNIDISSNKIVITDKGKGMSLDEFNQLWLHIGKSTKEYYFIDEDGKKRISAGQRGIGRFALARLGSYVKMQSKANGEDGIVWETNWDTTNSIDVDLKNHIKGTTFTIENLRDKWNDSDILSLQNFLQRTYNDNKMLIEILYNGEKYKINQYFKNIELGKNYTSKTSFFYNAKLKELQIKIFSEEFDDKAKKYCSNIDINKFSKSINVYNEFYREDFSEKEDKEYIEFLENIGNFSGELYFSLSQYREEDIEKFFYKTDGLEKIIESGIILFRNAFSISSLEGNRDWLELSKRVRKSPASPTHKTGLWRVRDNQIAGQILIDKNENPNIKDLSNRQGINENLTYKYFKKIIITAIDVFERYRQGIIRLINEKNLIIPESNIKVLSKIVSNKKSISDLSEKEQKQLSSEIKQLQTNKNLLQKQIIEKDENYSYDVRILNVLASLGLKAAAKAHEMKNDRNNIISNYDNIVKALKQYDYWDDLNSFEKTKRAHRNVPELLLKNKDISLNVLSLMNTILEDIEKEKFFPSKLNIFDCVNKIISKWKEEYKCVDFNINIRKDLLFISAEDIFTVILNNLILNSIQQNEDMYRKNQILLIDIEIYEMINTLIIKYSDNGVGLSPKYIDNPKKILAPHETTRIKGHGLGMWIINNTLISTGGKVDEITSKDGFHITMIIGDKLK